MKKKITLTIDDDVYDKLGEIPRKVSVSEVTSWFLRIFVDEVKLGRGLTDREITKLMTSTPEGEDFRERFATLWGTKMKKTEKGVGSLQLSKKNLKKKR